MRINHSIRRSERESIGSFAICTLTTASVTIKAFYEKHLIGLNKAGFSTTVICGYDQTLREFLSPHTNYIPLNLGRTFNPLQDFKALISLVRIFRTQKFVAVQYSTPKAALFGAIAAFLARIPLRLYLIWGLYYEGQGGIKRYVFKMAEKMACFFSTHVFPNSFEMYQMIINEHIASKTKCEVLANGSACGIDLTTYDPDKWRLHRSEIRMRLNIPHDGVVLGVFGRLTKDKGVNEIVSAFMGLKKNYDYVFLLVVGAEEEKDKISDITRQIIKTNDKIRFPGWQPSLLPYYAATDIFCLPSYREGFPQTLLEAQAMKIPVVASDIAGCREAIENTVTGFLVEPRNSEALIEPLRKLILNGILRKQMGEKARQRVERMFNQEDLIKSVVKNRLKLISNRHSKRPI